MTGNELACGKSHCNPRQHEGHQRGKAEKLFGAIQCLANFRACVAHIFKLFTGLELRFEPVAETFQLTVVARQQ